MDSGYPLSSASKKTPASKPTAEPNRPISSLHIAMQRDDAYRSAVAHDDVTSTLALANIFELFQRFHDLGA